MVSLLIILLAIVFLVVVGVAVIGIVVKLLLWALVGLVIGALARLVLPGVHPIGWLGTIAAGIAGALLGGLVANTFDFGGIFEFIVAVAAAAALIAAFAGGTRREYA